MVLTYTKKIKHIMFCVTCVYVRDRTNTFFSIFLLKVSRLSICSFSLSGVKGRKQICMKSCCLLLVWKLCHYGFLALVEEVQDTKGM